MTFIPVRLKDFNPNIMFTHWFSNNRGVFLEGHCEHILIEFFI